MARFDVYRNIDGEGYLLDCQADLLGHFATRFVVPLLPFETTPRELPRLMPVFEIENRKWVMATQLAAAVPARTLAAPALISLADHDMEIFAAIDMLISGF